MNLQVATFQRCERVSARPVTQVGLLAWRSRLYAPSTGGGSLCTLQSCRDHSSAVSLFQAQDANIERLTKAAAAVQNAVPCCPVTCDEKKRAPIQTTLDRFFKRVDRIESGKEPEPVPAASGVSEAAACPPSPAAADPSALDQLPPPLPPPVTNSSCLSLRAGCYTALRYFPRSCTVTLGVFSGVLCVIFVKSTIHPLRYCIADCVSWAPGLTVGITIRLDLGTRSQTGTCSYVEDLLY